MTVTDMPWGDPEDDVDAEDILEDAIVQCGEYPDDVMAAVLNTLRGSTYPAPGSVCSEMELNLDSTWGAVVAAWTGDE
jgi:hypothetical protein